MATFSIGMWPPNQTGNMHFVRFVVSGCYGISFDEKKGILKPKLYLTCDQIKNVFERFRWFSQCLGRYSNFSMAFWWVLRFSFLFLLKAKLLQASEIVFYEMFTTIREILNDLDYDSFVVLQRSSMLLAVTSVHKTRSVVHRLDKMAGNFECCGSRKSIKMIARRV